MVHCMAGAHRAGTAGVSYMMRGGQMSFQNALKLANQLRSVIDPFGDLAELLSRFEAAQQQLGYDTFGKVKYVKEHTVGFAIDNQKLNFTFDGQDQSLNFELKCDEPLFLYCEI